MAAIRRRVDLDTGLLRPFPVHCVDLCIAGQRVGCRLIEKIALGGVRDLVELECRVKWCRCLCFINGVT